MKWFPFLLAGGLAVGCAAMSASQGDTPYQQSPQSPHYVQYSSTAAPTADQYQAQPSTAPSAQDIDAAITAIKSATTAQAAMEAYSHAMALNPSSRELQEVYIRKMVDLNLPAEAVSASLRLLAVAPDHSLARAVSAFDEARRGDLPDAVHDIILAAQKSPEEPFIQKQAASILAWYDNTPNKPPLSQAIQDQIPNVRKTLEAQSTYADTYKQATDFYKQAQATAATQPVAANSPAPYANQDQQQPLNYGPMGPDPMDSSLSATGVAPYTDYYPGTATYYYPGYSSYASCYPYGGCYWGWSPYFCGADFLFFDHFYGHNFYGHHGWDGGRGFFASRGVGGSFHANVARPGFGSSFSGRSGYVPHYSTRSFASPGRTFSSGSARYGSVRSFSSGRSYGGSRSYSGGGHSFGGGGGGHGGGSGGGHR